MKKVLEVCVDSLASARAAITGGADRLELCSALSVGGLTPYTTLLRQIRAESDIEIRCLMRHRAGDFLYSSEELELLRLQILELKEAGANGFVIGCLTPEGELDTGAMEPLGDAAKGCPLTLHRAIDVSRDPLQTYRAAAEFGFDTVLTSGGAAGCTEGMQTIQALLSLRDELCGPEVLIGAGVNSRVISAFLTQCSTARAFHMSGKVLVESAMVFRRTGVPMGIPGFDEWHIQQTGEAQVAAARQALDP
jgi:copper homeostasis protein